MNYSSSVSNCRNLNDSGSRPSQPCTMPVRSSNCFPWYRWLSCCNAFCRVLLVTWPVMTARFFEAPDLPAPVACIVSYFQKAIAFLHKNGVVCMFFLNIKSWSIEVGESFLTEISINSRPIQLIKAFNSLKFWDAFFTVHFVVHSTKSGVGLCLPPLLDVRLYVYQYLINTVIVYLVLRWEAVPFFHKFSTGGKAH